jgi:hypothetical protein
MHKSLIAPAVALVMVGVVAVPSQALSNVTWSSGGTTRATFYEHAGFSGGVATVVGSSNCTATTTDVDNYISSGLMGSYSNEVSSSKDFAACDSKIYDAGDGSGTAYGYFNAGSTGVDYSAIGWNDRVSSLRLS